jgi:hypothetical protein
MSAPFALGMDCVNRDSTIKHLASGFLREQPQSRADHATGKVLSGSSQRQFDAQASAQPQSKFWLYLEVILIEENGPWKVYEESEGGKAGIMSDDFTHDVILWPDGDFRDNEQRKEYCEEIVKRLNAFKI